MRSFIPSFDYIYHKMETADFHYSLTYEKHRILYKVLEKYLKSGDSIVELGVCNGATAIMFSLCVFAIEGGYTGIDNWSLEGSRGKVEKLLVGLSENVPYHLIEGSSHDPENYCDYDFLLIDAGHDEANVSKDCALWLPNARKGNIVAFDDYPSLPSKENPHWAVREYAERYTYDWELIAYWEGLMVKRKV